MRSLASSPARRLWRAAVRSRSDLGVCLLSVGAAAGATALLAATPAAPPRAGLELPWWGILAAFALAERFPVHVHFRRGAHALTLGDLPLVVGLVFAAPATVAWAWAAAILLVLLPGRPSPVRLLFNVAMAPAVVATAAAVLHALPTAADGQLWLAAALGTAASSVVSAVLLASVMRVSGARMGPAQVGGIVASGVAVSAANASMALAIVVVLDANPWASLLLAGPTGVLLGAYRAYTQQRQQREELAFLYDASRTLAGAHAGTAGLAGVLARALEAFRAEVAEAWLLPAGDGESATRITVRAGGDVQVLEAPPAAVLDGLVELHATDRPSRVTTPAELGGPVGTHLEQLGAGQAMLTVLPGDGRLLGTLVVGKGPDESAFGRGELRLFETLAHHTGSALGQDQLVRRVATLRETEQRLWVQAFHDPLTSLANRLLFDDRVAHALSRRTGNVAIIYLDLDDFKPVNDRFGHEAGDAILRAVGERLRRTLRPADTPARLGGDEFAVLLVDIDPVHVPTVRDRILRSFAEPVALGDGVFRPISTSVGIAVADSGTATAEQLLHRADAAMYVAKRGRKRGRGDAPAPDLLPAPAMSQGAP